MRKLLVFLLVLVPAAASAQVGNCQTIMNKSNQTATVTGSTYTTSGYIYSARLEANYDAGTSSPTLDVIIEHSPDGHNFATIKSFTQVTTGTVSVEDKHFDPNSEHVYPYVRAKATIAGTNPQYDIIVRLCHD